MRSWPIVLLVAQSLLVGCSRAAPPPSSPRFAYVAMPNLPPRVAFDPDTVRDEDDGRSPRGRAVIQLAGAPAVREESGPMRPSPDLFALATHRVLYGQAARTMLPASGVLPAIDVSVDPSRPERIEREAQIALEVKDVQAAVARVYEFLGRRKGLVAKDERSSYASPGATLTLRVPAPSFDAFMSDLATIGIVRSSRTTSTEATLEHKDVEILLANLQAVQARYREILERTSDPGQVLAVERELERVRMDIERIQGRLDYLRDRVSYATLAVAIAPTPPAEAQPLATAYQATLATAVRAVSLVDVREQATRGYLGTGLSLRFPRSTGDAGRGFALDIDVMRACCGGAPRSDWAYAILTGLDLFSESAESGHRSWLNPFLGFRLGVVQTEGWVDFAGAAVVGLDVWRSRAVAVEAQVRLMALVGNPDGPHGAAQPQVGVNVGF